MDPRQTFCLRVLVIFRSHFAGAEKIPPLPENNVAALNGFQRGDLLFKTKVVYFAP